MANDFPPIPDLTNIPPIEPIPDIPAIPPMGQNALNPEIERLVIRDKFRKILQDFTVHGDLSYAMDQLERVRL